MKFTVSSIAFGKHLTKVSGVLMSNPILPILENFLFEIKNNTLIISASDMQTSVTTSLSIDITKEDDKKNTFNIAVPAKLLLETIKSIAEQNLSFEIDQNTYGITINSINGIYKLVGENAMDFPKMTIPIDSNEISIKSETLKSMLTTTMVTASKDELRPSINGVYMAFNKIGATFVSTDGYKLSRYLRYDIKYDQGEKSFIVPRKTIYTLNNILGISNDLPIKINFEETYSQFTIDNTTVISRLINEKFPTYENVIPNGNDKIATLDRLDLLKSLRRVSIFANKSTKYIGFSLKNDELIISAEDKDFSNEARETIICEYSAAPISMGFNVSSLIELLSSISAEEIELQLSEPNRACLIIPKQVEAAESILLLIMPMLAPSKE